MKRGQWLPVIKDITEPCKEWPFEILPRRNESQDASMMSLLRITSLSSVRNGAQTRYG
jgi:hypothetical protein